MYWYEANTMRAILVALVKSLGSLYGL